MEVSIRLQKSLVLYDDFLDHGIDLICVGYYPYLMTLCAYLILRDPSTLPYKCHLTPNFRVRSFFVHHLSNTRLAPEPFTRASSENPTETHRPTSFFYRGQNPHPGSKNDSGLKPKNSNSKSKWEKAQALCTNQLRLSIVLGPLGPFSSPPPSSLTPSSQASQSSADD